ncbi:DnaD domain protein [Ureibacillus sp. FSL K6-8385]|mgnify:CR=1 FL=1|uniref:Helicase DnaB n=1 Tax=Ureibacillus terrenus TaxID=118246 RepID=A0A540V1G0_9BACL|nr:DnaD domain protein [Ureibacillus terrenus]MED3764772.1 DnaD domain protein [Ureibacillus terrenus]TQE90594.1 helicase DnaB [Ureibacillus terrenus]
MVHLYKELQPKDHFDIILPHLSSHDRQLLTLFYQPLTGPEPISLYLTLWAEGEDPQKEPLTHYYLMNVLDMPIGKVFQARISLEAIGLLRSYRKDDGENRSFLYELVRPLDAETFFQDPLLSMFLFSKIGEHAYRKLRKRFINRFDKESYREVSRTFMDVYKPVHTNVPQEFIEHHVETNKRNYPFYYEQFDFDLLQAGLSEQLIPSRVFTLEVKEWIAKLAFLYQLSPLDMQKIVILAIDDEMRISLERLKKAAADYYKLTVSKEVPTFEKTFETDQQEENRHQPATKEEELIHYLETTPPIQVLRDINNGKEPVPSSVELAEDLILKHGMPVGVVNVLLEYVMLTTDMKLPRKYVERIADHWMRKNVRTAKEAMELARTERDQYMKWKLENEAKKSSAAGYKKPSHKIIREEKVPDWFYKRNEPEPEKDNGPSKEINFEEERRKILQKLGVLDG